MPYTTTDSGIPPQAKGISNCGDVVGVYCIEMVETIINLSLIQCSPSHCVTKLVW